MSKCFICPRECGVDREYNTGLCGEGSVMRVARAAPHYWEEPCISGENGSGAVFFGGCSLRCVYCQNREISRGGAGRLVSVSELADILLKLQSERVHNINFVTGTHFTPSIAETIKLSRKLGLVIPTVWNSSGYEKPETLRSLEGLIDVYLPDYKYFSSETARRLSNAFDYPCVALCAIDEYLRQVGEPYFENGLMKKGVIIRHLVLPGHVIESKQALKALFSRFGNRVYYSIMGQYTPMSDDLPRELCRALSESEYRSVVNFASEIGIENGFIQASGACGKDFVPDFDLK